MSCDYCGKSLSCADKPRYAPNGLPLFVCKKCYEKLSQAKKVVSIEEEETNGQNNR